MIDKDALSLIDEITKLRKLNRELVEAGNDLYEATNGMKCNTFVGLRLVGVRGKWNKIKAKAEAKRAKKEPKK